MIQTEDEMHQRFGKKPKTIKEYMQLLDAMIAEDFHMLVGKQNVCTRLETYQQQATFLNVH